MLTKQITADERRADLIEIRSKGGIPITEIQRLQDLDQREVDKLWTESKQVLESKKFVHEFRADKHHRIVRYTETHTSERVHPSEWTPPDTICTVFTGDSIYVGITPLHQDQYPSLKPELVYEYKLEKIIDQGDILCT